MKNALIATTMVIALGSGVALAPATTAHAQTTGASTQASQKNWLDEMNTRIDLAQAKVALLRAKIAMEIEKSPERASQALAAAKARFSQAKEAATAEAQRELQALANRVQQAQDGLAAAPAEARQEIDDLISAAETRLSAYKQAVLETDEAKLLGKRYAQIEAQAALLRAHLSEKADETGELTAAYLDEAKAWYGSTKEDASAKWQAGLSKITADINAAKDLVLSKRDEAGAAISDLTKRAAEFVREAGGE